MAFIGACGHSGTTLLATMLATHPDIYLPLRETEIFFSRDRNEVRAKVAALVREAEASGRPVLVEKTPRHVRCLGTMRDAAPGARIVLMVRDGRDVTTSYGKRLAGEFAPAVERWLLDTGIVATEIGKPDVLIVRYEDLVTDTEAELRRVTDHIGVDYRPEMLDYHREPHLWYGKTEVRHTDGVGSNHNDLRNWQVNQPMFDGRGRWRTDLPAEFVAQFREGRAAELMHQFGYDPDSD